MNIIYWQVQIQGRASDLEHLAHCFTTLPTLVAKNERDGGYLYQSAAFSACTSSQEVLAVADQEFAVLSGVLKIVRDSHEPLRSGAVFRRNETGGRDVFVHIRETIQFRLEPGEVTFTVKDADGNVVTRTTSLSRTVLLAQLAASDAAVAKAMRLDAKADARTWVGLYRIFEVIRDDVGGQVALIKRNLSSAADPKRFTRSANSVAVAGDAARHGNEDNTPPKHPMSLDEATAFVDNLLQAWLVSKGV